MQAEFAEASPLVRDTYEEAGEALGRDLWTLSREGSAEELALTENTQPLMLAAGIAAWRVWRDRGGAEPAWLAGHSLGEYTALVAAGALAFPDAVRLVAERARFMQEAVAEDAGAMAAVLGLDDEAVHAACAGAAGSGVVEALAIRRRWNAPSKRPRSTAPGGPCCCRSACPRTAGSCSPRPSASAVRSQTSRSGGPG
jgi:[acyl-carrier-protein] S-malonyltransferase